ncbi:MAG: hypothetical protein IJ801_03635, partial [Lachnospiraceae bacterium]|nr:hypothetical protein [Lachnospiraceae bacterium]
STKQSAGEEVALEAYLVSRLEQMQTSIDVSAYAMTGDKIYDVFSAVINRHPEFYYVNTGLRWTYDEETNCVVNLIVTYSGYDRDAVEQELARTLELVEDDMSDLEKVIFIHDYLCEDIEYAYRDVPDHQLNEDVHNLKGAVLDKYAVCDGYACAFLYYMQKLGIPCNIVTNDTHAWNQVCLTGHWYMVDVTYDDPLWDYYGNVSHIYLLNSAETFAGKDHEWDVAKYEFCTDTTYDNAFWRASHTQLLRHEGDWYVVDVDRNLYRHNFDRHALDQKGDLVTSLGGVWNVYGQENQYYTENYTCLAARYGLLFYSQPDGVYVCDFEGTGKRQIIAVDNADGYVYGMRIGSSGIEYQIATVPHEKERIEKTSEQELLELSGLSQKTGQDITLSATQITLTYGTAPFSMDASVEGGELHYTSEDPKVVTVDDSGTVTVQGVGTTRLQLTTEGDETYRPAEVFIEIQVTPADLPEAVRLVQDTFVYTGEPLTPEVQLDGLEMDRDYTVTYRNNSDVAGADAEQAPTIVITGIGNYTGTQRIHFTIQTAASGSMSAAQVPDPQSADPVGGTTEQGTSTEQGTTTEQGTSAEQGTTEKTTESSGQTTASESNRATTINLKNKKIYKITTKVKIKDADGILSVKLNSKKVKLKKNATSVSFRLSKYKKSLKKKTWNKLVVKDQKGKKTTIRFKIR